MRFAAVLGAMLALVFAGRLLQLQGIDGSAYARQAELDRLRTVTLPAQRGDITDRNGVVLATSVNARNVTADQTLVQDPARTAQALAPLLGIRPATLQQRLTGDRRFAYVARQVTPEVWNRVAALNLPGIFSEPASKRVYPADGLAANVIGFVGQDNTGLEGVEYAWQKLLAGSDGHVTYEAGAGGRQIPTADSTELQPVPGKDVRLTIDRDIQFVAQQAIASQVRASGAASGTVVVQDPRTGAILALATAPGFDPNRPGLTKPEDRGNRALSEVYEPGSTSKVMTMAAVLQERRLRPDSVIDVPASVRGSAGLRRGGRTFHDAEDHGEERLTLTGVLAKSSNIGTILAAETIGPRVLDRYLTAFGIGQRSGLGFPGETAGLLPDVDTWGPEEFSTIAFGQGLALDAVQATSVYSTIANDGLRVTPQLVAGSVASDGRLTPAPAPRTERVISPAVARELRAMLESVVSEQGTAPMAQIAGYRVAGKTGTANRVDPTCSCYRGYTASFIGFAPADAPRLVVSVTLQDPKRGHYGGRLGGPVFKTVMGFALQALDIPPTGTTPPRFRLTPG